MRARERGSSEDGLPIRVIDLSGPPGFFAARLLVGLGAEVIRIEPPGGDPLRAEPLAFAHWHAGKRSVALDLETSEGRAALLRLAATADVLVESYRPGHLERLRLAEAAPRP